MAPGRKRGAKGVKKMSELSLGDLVLAKVKGFPAWPAKISSPEDWSHAPDPKKYFVHFFGTSEIAFVAPADIQAFTSDTKNKLSARCQGKTAGDFTQAVKEISEEFDVLQCKNLSRTRDDKDAENLTSEFCSTDPVEDEALAISAEYGIDRKEPKCKLEINGLSDQGSGFGCSQLKGEMEFEDVKPFSSDDIDRSLPVYISPGKRSKLSANSSSPLKDAVSGSNQSHHASMKDVGSCQVIAEDGFTDGGRKELADNHKSKLLKGSKRKHEELLKNKGSIKLPENTGDKMQLQCASGGNMKVSSAGNSRMGSDLGGGSKGNKLPQEIKNPITVDSLLDISVEHTEVNPSKKMKFQPDRGKLNTRTIESPSPAKILKSGHTVDGPNVLRPQTSRKIDHKNPVDQNTKVDKTESKQLASGGKVDNHQSCRANTINNQHNLSVDEDDASLAWRDSQAEGILSTSPSNSENVNGDSASNKIGMGNSNKVLSSGMLLPKKRRAVRICHDDDDDELPKTPIHGGVSQGKNKSSNSSIAEPKKKIGNRDEGYANDQHVLRNSGLIGDALKKGAPSSLVPNKTSSPTAEKGIKKRTKEASADYASPDHRKVDSEKLFSVDAKSAVDSSLSVSAVEQLAEPQKKHLNKTPVIISQKKVPSGSSRGITTISDGPPLKQPASEKNNPTSDGEKKNSTQLLQSQINSVNPDENVTALSERLNVGTDNKTSVLVNSKTSDSIMSMKHLIAAAQARKKQTHSQNPPFNHLQLVFPDADMLGLSVSPNTSTPRAEPTKTVNLDVLRLHPNLSSSADVHQLSSVNEHEKDELLERRVSSGRQATVSSLSGDTEAAVARDAFEGMIETLSRTKESIGRATRLAIDCAKYGISNEVVELLIRKLENESSFYRRVDLFFLVDSITQCSHSQKGIAGASYLPIIQAALPRLIRAAAPLGTSAHENRRQCHKVLRLWLERKIFPETALRRHMDDIGAVNGEASAGISQRRPSRAERAFDDPIRDMEGMLVDEYGSNATFQLSGLLLPHFFDEEEEGEKNIPTGQKEVLGTSPSECTPATRDPKNSTVTPNDEHHCILEDVDGELEMEDVSAQPKVEGPLSRNANFCGSYPLVSSSSEFLPSPEGSPPLPLGSPPATPPLPTSPPPPPSSPPPPPPPPSPPPPPPSSPPPPPPPPPSSDQHQFPPQLPVCPPPISNQLLPPSSAIIMQHMPPPPPVISSSQQLTYRPPLAHDIGSSTPTVNQYAHMVSNTHGSHVDASIRGEVFSQQPHFFSPAAVGNVGEHVAYKSSRPVEYGKSDVGYLNAQASQPRQLFVPSITPLTQRPQHQPISQQTPSPFTYPNTASQQNLFHPYPSPNLSDGVKRSTVDDRWRMQVNEFNTCGPRRGWTAGGRALSGQPYLHEGYFESPMERPPTKIVNFQPAGNSLPPAPISVHGAQIVSIRPDASASNWRPT